MEAHRLSNKENRFVNLSEISSVKIFASLQNNDE